MRKVASILVLITSLSFLASIRNVYAANYVAINPSSTSSTVNNVLSFSINVSVMSLYGYEFKVSYNSTVINVTSITKGTFFPDSNIYEVKNQINNTGGYIWYAIFLLKPEVAKSGLGILLNVTAKALAVGNTTLHIYDCKLGDSSASLIVHTTYDGTVSITTSGSSGTSQGGGAGGIQIQFDITASSVHQFISFVPFRFIRNVTIELVLFTLFGTSGDAIINWNITSLDDSDNDTRVICSSTETVYVNVGESKNYTISTLQLDEGRYIFKATVVKYGMYDTKYNIASKEFYVGNVYYEWISSMAIMIGIVASISLVGVMGLFLYIKKKKIFHGFIGNILQTKPVVSIIKRVV